MISRLNVNFKFYTAGINSFWGILILGALEIRPKAPESFVRAVSLSQVFEAAVVVKADDLWGGRHLVPFCI
jgi:hypothetical protein